jgi:hypothetical protein
MFPKRTIVHGQKELSVYSTFWPERMADISYSEERKCWDKVFLLPRLYICSCSNKKIQMGVLKRREKDDPSRIALANDRGETLPPPLAPPTSSLPLLAAAAPTAVPDT